MISPVELREIPELVRLQKKTLPGSLPSHFGTEFLDFYYRTLIPDPDFFCFSYCWQSEMVAFVTFASDAQAAFRRALKGNLTKYARILLKSLLRRPSRLIFLAKLAPVLLGIVPEPGGDIAAELISWGILPTYRRSSKFFEEHGISVSHELFDHAIKVLESHQVQWVKAFVAPIKINPYINSYMENKGFKFAGTARRMGYTSNMYIRNLADS